MISKLSENQIYKLGFRITVIFLLTYGFLYSGYKLWTPEITGGSDFYEYYKMFQNPINNDASSPFIYRQFTAWTVYLIDNLNLSYNTLISFNNPLIDQSTFLSIIISNYLALVFTSLIIIYAVDYVILKKSFLLPLSAGLIVFFSFNTFTHNISGIYESWSWFFYALIFFLYLKKSNWIYVIILLSIFQREVIPIVFGVLSFLDYVFDFGKNNKQKFWLDFYFRVFSISFFAFILYFLIRTQFFPVQGNENQVQIIFLLETLLNFRISISWFVPVFLSQNIFIVYLLSVISNRFNNDLLKQTISLFLIYFFLTLIGISTGLGSNLGRILSQLNPILIILIFKNLNLFYLKSKN